MRRRQQDHGRIPKHQHPHGNVSLRGTRQLTAAAGIIVGVTVIFWLAIAFHYFALHNLHPLILGESNAVEPATSLYNNLQEGSSTLLRGNNNFVPDDREQQQPLQTKQRRVIAVGDIHGDKDALVRALQLANLVDSNNGQTWIGGADILVQIGDLLNKAEPRDEETLAYIVQIEKQARDVGGKVVVTVGDHDLHNAPKLWKLMQQQQNQQHDGKVDDEPVPFPSWMYAAYVVDNTLFVHGSLSKSIFEDGSIHHQSPIVDMNQAAQAWLAGNGPKPNWIGRGDGPIWSRLYSSDKELNEHANACDDLRLLLDELLVKRMVVGHTVRREGISSVCDGLVWRIDVGLSRTETRAGKIGASEVLELSDGGLEARVLSTDVKLKTWEGQQKQ